MTIYVENFGKVIAILEQRIQDLERRVDVLETPKYARLKGYIRKAGARGVTETEKVIENTVLQSETRSTE